MSENLLEFSNITKKFPGVIALNKVTFDIKCGEVLALCGENGAGKSTLINLLGGSCLPDEGTIIYDGERVIINNPSKSEELKIATVYQEVPVCPNLTIAENIFMSGKPINKYGMLDRKVMREKTKKILEVFKIFRHPDEIMEDLSLAEQSFVQIAKAIYHEPDFLILDEPTSSLSEEQKELLFNTLNDIRKKRTLTILYVSHRMAEIFQISDRIAVLRDGCYTGTVNTKDVTYDDVIKMMVGRELNYNMTSDIRGVGATLLEVKNLSRGRYLKNVNFTLNKGEILGFSGFQGAGRTEMARAIFGLDKSDSCEIFFEGKKVKINKPSDAIKLGIGFITENRKEEGIIPLMSVKDNMLMTVLKAVSVCGFFVNKKVASMFQKYVNILKIKISGPEQLISNLSGGNQQKVIISKWLAQNPKILICDEPTRGIDIGAKTEIHSILRKLADDGVSVIVISSELTELIGISDRIIVMHEGKITGVVMKNEVSEERIMKLIAAI